MAEGVVLALAEADVLALGDALALGETLALGDVLALGDMLELGVQLVAGVGLQLGFGLADVDVLALADALGLADALVLGETLALGDVLVCGDALEVGVQPDVPARATPPNGPVNTANAIEASRVAIPVARPTSPVHCSFCQLVCRDRRKIVTIPWVVRLVHPGSQVPRVITSMPSIPNGRLPRQSP